MLWKNIRNTSKVSLRLFLITFITASYFNNCDASRILGFFPIPSKSHLIIHCAVMEALADQGHDVTVFQTTPNFLESSKYKMISIEVGGIDPNFLREAINNPQPFYKNFGIINAQMTKHTNLTINHPATQQFLRDHKDSFDLVILGYFINEYYLGIGAHFNCPIIISSTLQPFLGINGMLGNPTEAAYVPTVFGGLKQPMSFLKRVQNFLLVNFEHIVQTAIINSRMESTYKDLFPPDRYPSLDEMRKNVSLILCNHHFSQGPIRPNVPAVVEIGGIAIKEKPSPPPADISQILENATQGIIYVSFGSNVQGSHLSPEKVQIMFDVLSSLSSYQILWKWGNDTPGKAKNIIYKSWLPQNNVLAHPNVKLFITHGGLGSVVESQYHGVPMVGIPLFADQPTNMMHVEESGYGLKVDYATLTASAFKAAILEVLQNDKYRKAVRQFSEIYRDRPMTARQTAIFWVEYVLRHRGAKHLQSPAVHLNYWQLTSLDVIGFLLSILIGAIFILKFICKKILTYLRGKKKEQNAKKKLQ